MRKTTWRARAVALAGVAALALTACGGGGDGGGGDNDAGSEPTAGGTLTILSPLEKLQHLDPQLIYTGEDAQMAQSYWQRQLVVFKVSPDPEVGNTLVGDLATDTGTPNDDATEWVFQLRDGATWDDGKPLTCQDIAYGISRQFSTVTGGGPKYMVDLLDIPKNAKGESQYNGPYEGDGQELFDKAVVCGDGTITFKLNQPSPDFNYALTWGTAPVPKDRDTGVKYDDAPATSGPYKIESAKTNVELVLVRNENWNKETDPYRPAYPDKIVFKYGIQGTEIDQRLIADAGDDKNAIQYGSLDTSSLATVFNDPATEPRRVNEYSPYSLYIAINNKLVPNLKHRQAMAIALDRAQMRTNLGGEYAGDLADGVVKPNIGQDYAESGMWESMFGAPVPDSGDPERAKQLIAESGETPPVIRYQYRASTPALEQNAGVVKTSLEKAGFSVKLESLPLGDFYTIIFDDEKAHELMNLGWGADWPNASTVLGPLFSSTGSWNLSRVSDKTYDDRYAAARINLDRAAQAKEWQELNKYAMEKVWAIPTTFENDQRLAGSNVASASAPEGRNVYLWGAAGSWPYVDLFVKGATSSS
jgi:peptide/nickel transport system substrate-binding protein